MFSTNRIRTKLASLTLSGLLLVTVSACAGAQTEARIELVRLATHDSFVMPDELIADFQQETGYRLEIIRMGDTGSLTSQLALTKAAPVADAFYGIDNTFLPVAQDEGFLAGDVSAINFGDVCFNYDVKWFADNDLTPPANWRELIKPEYRGLTVLSNPLLSSPGLAFLATTHAGFDSSAEVFEYWRNLRDNELRTSASWDDAYFVDFTRYGGDRPIVLSYAASPSAEINPDGSAGTVALLDECFRQTEFSGVIAGAANQAGAQALVSYLAGERFQASVAENMYVYPALESVPLPDTWQEYAPAARSVIGQDLDIAALRDQWLEDWASVFDN
jgi:thiamine transport system substrate-binding protein